VPVDAPKAGGKFNLTAKAGPLKVWQWGLIGGAAVGIYIWRKNQSSSSTAATTGTGTTTGTDTGYPYDSSGGLGSAAGGGSTGGSSPVSTPFGENPGGAMAGPGQSSSDGSMPASPAPTLPAGMGSTSTGLGQVQANGQISPMLPATPDVNATYNAAGMPNTVTQGGQVVPNPLLNLAQGYSYTAPAYAGAPQMGTATAPTPVGTLINGGAHPAGAYVNTIGSQVVGYTVYPTSR